MHLSLSPESFTFIEATWRGTIQATQDPCSSHRSCFNIWERNGGNGISPRNTNEMKVPSSGSSLWASFETVRRPRSIPSCATTKTTAIFKIYQMNLSDYQYKKFCPMANLKQFCLELPLAILFIKHWVCSMFELDLSLGMNFLLTHVFSSLWMLQAPFNNVWKLHFHLKGHYTNS